MDKLSEIPDNTFDCIITSPPYWALRDYSIKGQWGLETTYKEYLEKMKLLMKQLKRILKGTGSCWINIGDTYSTVSGGMKDIASGKIDNSKHGYLKENIAIDQSKFHTGLQQKSRIGIPERFYINCIDSGWIARNDVTWIKWNAMPMSVKDRFTNKKESVYFFVKEQKYYFRQSVGHGLPIVAGLTLEQRTPLLPHLSRPDSFRFRFYKSVGAVTGEPGGRHQRGVNLLPHH